MDYKEKDTEFEKKDVDSLDEMSMDTLNHPTHGKLSWENNGGVHQIKKGEKTVFSGTHEEVAAKWKAVKNSVSESFEARDGKVSAEAVIRYAKEMFPGITKLKPIHLSAAREKILDNIGLDTDGKKIEEATSDDVEKWKQSVKDHYPEHADKIQFKVRDQAKHISAEIPNVDRSFGVYDMEKEQGHILESEEVKQISESANQFVKYVQSDMALEAKATFEAMIDNKIKIAIDAKRKSTAQALFNKQ